MRGLLIAILSAIVTLSSCAHPEPRSPVVTPKSEVSPTGDVHPTPATTTASPRATPSSPKESLLPAKPPGAVAAPVEPPASPTLDLAGLEQRLRDTHAIGVFTKLSLKNQVDDLLAQFRGFYAGQIKVPLAELRRRYELLLLQVVSLLQDADQQLASAISSSREAIWGILADPKKFATI